MFEGLSIWQEEIYRELQRTYPVISLTFANIKERDYTAAKIRICQILTELYLQNAFLLEGDTLTMEYKLALTNLEVKIMFYNMVHEWFGRSIMDYNDFVKALLRDDVKAMNAYMNQVALVGRHWNR